MFDVMSLLERQARWQRSLKDLPWPEKIRMAERIRPAVERWRAMAAKDARTPPDPWRAMAAKDARTPPDPEDSKAASK